MQLHTRYVRLPDSVSDFYDDLIYRSKRIVVASSQVMAANAVTFDGKVVLASGYPIVYFNLMGKWFGVGKVRDLHGEHTGYYCDIVVPPRLLDDGGLEITDLFLDLWVAPDLRYKVLDEKEMDDALQKGFITEQLFNKARLELAKLIARVKRGDFPPRSVKRLEKTLNL